jgi:hypothetical protein
MKEKPGIWFTPLHSAECSHAIAKQVFYRKISQAEANAVFDTLEHDRADGLWRETAMPENAFEVCADLGRRYGPKLGIRTLDISTSPAPSNSERNGFGPSMSGRRNWPKPQA